MIDSNPNSLVAQIEAASVLQTKGMSQSPEAAEALQQAIQGTDKLWVGITSPADCSR
ncbi:MAG: hypothetical protein R3C11_12570 [Planctomycetaceae bacterium]